MTHWAHVGKTMVQCDVVSPNSPILATTAEISLHHTHSALVGMIEQWLCKLVSLISCMTRCSCCMTGQKVCHHHYHQELCFGAKYGTFLATQKLPNLETLSCLQVVATFENIEVCQNWQPQSFQECNKSKISKIGNFQFAKIGSFPNVETFDAPLLEALRYHKVSKSGVVKKDTA